MSTQTIKMEVVEELKAHYDGDSHTKCFKLHGKKFGEQTAEGI